MRRHPISGRTSCGAILIILIGLSVIALSGWTARDTFQFLSKADSTQGTVVEVTSHLQPGGTDTNGNPVSTWIYSPRVEFEPVKGDKRQFGGAGTSDAKKYQKGQTLEVLYLKDDPNTAKINSFKELWGQNSLLAGLGLFIVLIGCLLARSKGKPRGERDSN